jgi:hypothetical protein
MVLLQYESVNLIAGRKSGSWFCVDIFSVVSGSLIELMANKLTLNERVIQSNKIP